MLKSFGIELRYQFANGFADRPNVVASGSKDLHASQYEIDESQLLFMRLTFAAQDKASYFMVWVEAAERVSGYEAILVGAAKSVSRLLL